MEISLLQEQKGVHILDNMILQWCKDDFLEALTITNDFLDIYDCDKDYFSIVVCLISIPLLQFF